MRVSSRVLNQMAVPPSASDTACSAPLGGGAEDDETFRNVVPFDLPFDWLEEPRRIEILERYEGWQPRIVRMDLRPGTVG